MNHPYEMGFAFANGIWGLMTLGTELMFFSTFTLIISLLSLGYKYTEIKEIKHSEDKE